MFFSYFILHAIFVYAEFTGAISERGQGYKGCYRVDAKAIKRLHRNLTSYNITNVDTCLIFCRNDFKKFSLISTPNCFCTETFLDNSTSLKEEDESCEDRCSGNSMLYCVFKTDIGFCSPLEVPENGRIDQYLFRVGNNVTFSCLPGYRLNGSTKLHCVESQTGNNESGKWSDDVPTCNNTVFTTLWFRIVIDIVAVLVMVFIIGLVFLLVRHFRRRRQGIFHHWKPHTLRQSSSLRSEGNRIRFQNQSNMSVSAPLSVNRHGQGSISQEVDDNSVAILTPEFASDTADRSVTSPASGRSGSAIIKRRNSFDVVVPKRHTALSDLESEKQESGKEAVENSSVNIFSTLRHEHDESNISPIRKKERPGSSKDAILPQSITLDKKSAGSAGSDANTNSGERTAVKLAVRPKSCRMHRSVSESFRSAASLNAEEQTSVNSAVRQKNTTLDRRATASALFLNNEASNPIESPIKTEDSAPVIRELASVMDMTRLSQSVRASKKPQVAQRRLTRARSMQIDNTVQCARNSFVSEPIYAVPDEQPDYKDQSERTSGRSNLDDADKGYCSLRVGPLDTSQEEPTLREEGASANNNDPDDEDMDDADYAQLRVGLSDVTSGSSDIRVSVYSTSDLSNPVEEQGADETPENGIYEMVKIS